MNKKSFSYCFILGINHTLAKVEIINILLANNIKFKIIEASQETLIISSQEKIEGLKLINISGNIAKLAKIFADLPLNGFSPKFLEEIVQEDFGDSVLFGVSVYGSGGGAKKLNEIWRLVPRLCPEIKNSLIALGKKVRFLPPKERKLSTVSVDKNLLSKQGLEIVLCVSQEKIYVGKTIAVQDYESYSFRDYSRPRRDMKSGMIPPKLAKTMINLANKDKKQFFLDPFCGMGTILEELVLLGYKNIIGTDIQEKAIVDSRVNLDWLFQNYRSLEKADYHINLKKCDVRNLSKTIFSQKIDAIITEPYLGSPQLKYFNPRQIKNETRKIESLYLDAFREFKKILSKEGVVVIVFPVFRFRNKFFYLEILDEIKRLGFKRKRFLSPTIAESTAKLLQLKITKRGSIVYYRPGQTVSREIFIFISTRNLPLVSK